MWPVVEIAFTPVGEGVISSVDVANGAVGFMKLAISAVTLAESALVGWVFRGYAEPRRLCQKERTSRWRRRGHC